MKICRYIRLIIATAKKRAMKKSQSDDAYDETRAFKKNAVDSILARDVMNEVIDRIESLIKQFLNVVTLIKKVSDDRIQNLTNDFSIILMKLDDETTIFLRKIQKNSVAWSE